MDETCFAELLRTLSTSPSRRSALRLLTGTALGSFLSLGALPAQAKKGKRKSKKKVTICHQGQRIRVAKKTWKGHQKHGDYMGPCPMPSPSPPPPPPVTCAGQPEGAPCQGSGSTTQRCCAGSCPAEPTCIPGGQPCPDLATCGAQCCTGSALSNPSGTTCASNDPLGANDCVTDTDCRSSISGASVWCVCQKCCLGSGVEIQGTEYGCQHCCNGCGTRNAVCL